MDVTQSPQPTLLARLADWSYRRRERVLLLWIVLLVATIVGRGRVRWRLRLHVHDAGLRLAEGAGPVGEQLPGTRR